MARQAPGERDGPRFRTRNSRRFGKQSAGRYGRQRPERLSGLSDLRQHLSGGVQRFLLPCCLTDGRRFVAFED